MKKQCGGVNQAGRCQLQLTIYRRAGVPRLTPFAARVEMEPCVGLPWGGDWSHAVPCTWADLKPRQPR